MPLYIGDYLADTMHLNATESGAYLFLIMHYWRTGPLLDVERTLATVARVELEEWVKSVGPVVRRFFSVRDGKLHHKRIDAELGNATLNLTSRQKSASAAGLASAAKRKAQREFNGRSIPVDTTVEKPLNGQLNGSATGDPTGIQLEATPSPSPSPLERKNPTGSKESSRSEPNGSRLPPDWDPGEDAMNFARKHGLNPQATLQEFRDYWVAKPGKEGRKLDWQSTWRNWCRRDRRSNGGLFPPGPSPPTDWNQF